MITNPLSCIISRYRPTHCYHGVKKQIWPPCRHIWNRTGNKMGIHDGYPKLSLCTKFERNPVGVVRVTASARLSWLELVFNFNCQTQVHVASSKCPLPDVSSFLLVVPNILGDVGVLGFVASPILQIWSFESLRQQYLQMSCLSIPSTVCRR